MELRNALSKAQLDRLRPLPLVVEVDNTTVSPLLLGVVTAGQVVRECVIEVTSALPPGVAFTVGDTLAQGRFQAASDNIPTEEETYPTWPNYQYSSDTSVYVYITGTITTGAARVILYLN
jgi:hypothetical protein